MTSPYANLLADFSAITLNQLNTQASLMNRVESKYLIHEENVGALLKDLKENFYILEIKGHKMFSYDNVYMDTKEYDCYYDHHNKEHKRMKIRSRHYVESDVAYFEFNQKEGSVLRKFRYEIDPSQHGTLDTTAYEFVSDVYSSIYSKDIEKLVFPSIGTNYKRITFCSKTSAEKITIDTNLSFTQHRGGENDVGGGASKGTIFKVPNVMIIEFKAETKQSPTRDLLESHNLTCISSCSKYCLGNYFLGNINERKRFTKTINEVKAIMHTDSATTKGPLRQMRKFETVGAV